MSSGEGPNPNSQNGELKTPINGVSIPVDNLNASNAEEGPIKYSEEDLEHAKTLRAQIGNVQIEVLRNKYTLEEAIRAIEIKSKKDVPTRLAKETVDSAILYLAPEINDRKLLYFIIGEEKKESERELDSPDMERIQATGQEHHYPEYRDLQEKNSRLYAVMRYLEDLEERVNEQKALEEKRTNELLDDFYNKNLSFIIGRNNHKKTLKQLLDMSYDLVKYTVDNYDGKKYERMPADQETVKDDLRSEISRVLKNSERALLIKRFRESEETKKYANILDQLR